MKPFSYKKQLFWFRDNFVLPTAFMLLRLVWFSQSFRRKRQVLLVISHPLIVGYLRRVQRLLEQDMRVDFALTNARRSQNPEVSREIAIRMDLPYQTFYESRTRKWDLIVFSDHSGVCRFAPQLPKLQVYHSLSGGKVIEGENYRFGAKHTIYRNKPLYDLMFVSSYGMERRALATNSLLKGRLAVVGDPDVDNLLAMNANREAIRQELGFRETDKVILIQSTIRQHSLIESMGAKILKIVGTLLSEYKFVLSTHPNYWTTPPSHPSIFELIIQQRLNGITVMSPGDSWERYAIASDACLSDYTGLVCNYALLKKPLAMIKMTDGLLSDGAEESIIYDAVPHLDFPEELPQLLASLIEDFPLEKLTRATSQILSCPGQSETLMRAHLYELLNLDPRAAA